MRVTASTVEELVEGSVTNVMDYGMNTPLAEQRPSGYLRAVTAPVVSSVMIPHLVPKMLVLAWQKM